MDINSETDCPYCGTPTDEVIFTCADCGVGICDSCACGDGDICEGCHEKRQDEEWYEDYDDEEIDPEDFEV